MKTLADFKRALTIGRKVKVTNFNAILLNSCALAPWKTLAEVDGKPCVTWESEVKKASGTEVGFKIIGKEGETLSWLTFPKASEFKVINDKAHIYWEVKAGQPAVLVLTYEFI